MSVNLKTHFNFWLYIFGYISRLPERHTRTTATYFCFGFICLIIPYILFCVFMFLWSLKNEKSYKDWKCTQVINQISALVLFEQSKCIDRIFLCHIWGPSWGGPSNHIITIFCQYNHIIIKYLVIFSNQIIIN